MADQDFDYIGRVFEAVHAPLTALYGDQRPSHLGTMIRWKDGGPDPLDGVSIYWNDAGYWLFVGFGLSENGLKESGVPELSGWGCELTFRLYAPKSVLADVSIDPELGIATPCLKAPRWPVHLLNDVARYVFANKAMLAHGHFIKGQLPFPWLGLVTDPEFSEPCETPNGRFNWLQVVVLDSEQFAELNGDDWEAWLASRLTDWHIHPNSG